MLRYAVEALNRLVGGGCDDAMAVFFGSLRDPHALDGLRLPYVSLGTISDPAALRELYSRASAVLSSSLYETLPGIYGIVCHHSRPEASRCRSGIFGHRPMRER